MNSEKFKLPKRFTNCEKNVWIEYSELARKYKPVNLGQGAPDFTAPKILTDALEELSKENDHGLHQYPRGFGYIRLVNILSKLYSPLFNKEINPMDEILTTNGATQAVYCAVLGFIEEGDEVIVIEPYFDLYDYVIQMAGGTPRYIPLKPKKDATSASEWVLDYNDLENLFNSKTKMILLNTPHNPTGKVFTKMELEKIAELCIKWDVLCISDEVYEWMYYKPSVHFRIATLPGMWDRTITVGSAGKIFGVTGWRVGWAIGPLRLLHHMRVLHQNCVYSSSSPLQDALARVFEREETLLEKEESYFKNIVIMTEKKRNYLANVLKEVGMKPFIPDGGYFMLADYSNLKCKADLSSETDKYEDYRFTKWMIKNLGLQCIPLSAFYSEPNKHLGEKYVRFCFIKKDENLEKASNILKNWKKLY